MGKAGLAVLVLGTAACATKSSGDDPTTTAGAAGTTGGDSTATPTTTAESTSSTSAAPGSGSNFHRVNLGFVSAYILYRDGEAALVDTGVSGSAGAIEGALGEIGLGWDSVGHVVVTHHHPDHQGSLGAVLEQTDGAPWYAGAGDLGAVNASTEGTAVGDGESVFGLDIIETPGHTLGHIAVLDAAAGVLVAGDALNGTGDGSGVAGANPDFSVDMEMANASVEKLGGFDYDVALFGHGEPLLESASSAVADLAANLG